MAPRRPTIRLAIVFTALLATRALAEECQPAAPDVVAAAAQKAADADARATHAESIAVRSGNPGAQARADEARAEATAARDELARLRCEPLAPKKAGPLLRPPGRGY